MSGHRFNPNFVYPTYGSVVSYQKGFKNRLPPFIQLGKEVNTIFGGGTAGYLGIVYNPFEIVNDPNSPSFSAGDVQPPPEIDAKRGGRRREMLGRIEALQRRGDRQPELFNSLDKDYQAALDLITAPEAKPRLRDRPGRPAPTRSLRPHPLRPELSAGAPAHRGRRPFRDG